MLRREASIGGVISGRRAIGEALNTAGAWDRQPGRAIDDGVDESANAFPWPSLAKVPLSCSAAEAWAGVLDSEPENGAAALLSGPLSVFRHLLESHGADAMFRRQVVLAGREAGQEAVRCLVAGGGLGRGARAMWGHSAGGGTPILGLDDWVAGAVREVGHFEQVLSARGEAVGSGVKTRGTRPGIDLSEDEVGVEGVDGVELSSVVRAVDKSRRDAWGGDLELGRLAAM